MEAASCSAAGMLGLERAVPRRSSTKRRLHIVFAALAASFALAFAQQLAGLDRMGRTLQRIEELDVSKRLALELEREVRNQFIRQTLIAPGAEAHLVSSRESNAQIARLAAELHEHVADAETNAAVSRILAATRELEGILGEGSAAAAAESGAISDQVQRAAYQLVFDVEESVDALVATLQALDAKECASVEIMRRSTLRLALLLLAAMPVLAVAMGFHVSRSVARPLRIIGDGAARLAAGDLGTRIDAGGPQEFDVLASQVNAMAAELERNHEDLVRSKTLAGLGRMAAGIAHEINNPLQVMLGYLSYHRDRVGGDLGRDLERMEKEATRCREIVGSLLQLARPSVPPPAEPVDLREVSLDVAGALKIAMNGSVGTIRVAGEGTARASQLAVRQILLNLARNAVEAAGPAGTVEIRVAADESRALVSVSDTGPGVPREHRERVFDPFFTTKPTGTGLGLPLARSIAGALGGDLDLEPAERGGARFTLRLPLGNAGARS